MNTNTNAKLLESHSDELERLVLEEVHKRRRVAGSVAALVLPAGDGDLAVEMAGLGCRVTGIDDARFAGSFRNRAIAAGVGEEIRFQEAEGLDCLPHEMIGEPFDVVYVRRGLCTLPYGKARHILRKLLLKLKIGGKLYLSILGVHSELGDNYPGIDDPVEERFCRLAPGMATKYDIDQPVCLYSERNLFLLLLEAGGSVLRTFTSTHGNVKGIAVRV